MLGAIHGHQSPPFTEAVQFRRCLLRLLDACCGSSMRVAALRVLTAPLCCAGTRFDPSHDQVIRAELAMKTSTVPGNKRAAGYMDSSGEGFDSAGIRGLLETLG